MHDIYIIVVLFLDPGTAVEVNKSVSRVHYEYTDFLVDLLVLRVWFFCPLNIKNK